MDYITLRFIAVIIGLTLVWVGAGIDTLCQSLGSEVTICQPPNDVPVLEPESAPPQ